VPVRTPPAAASITGISISLIMRISQALSDCRQSGRRSPSTEKTAA
jgi:hypothetical protein